MKQTEHRLLRWHTTIIIIIIKGLLLKTWRCFFFHTKLSTDRERACTRHTTTTKRDKRAQRRILGINCMVHMKSIIPKFEMAFFCKGSLTCRLKYYSLSYQTMFSSQSNFQFYGVLSHFQTLTTRLRLILIREKRRSNLVLIPFFRNFRFDFGSYPRNSFCHSW